MVKSLFIVVLTAGLLGMTATKTEAAATRAASTNKATDYSTSQPPRGDVDKPDGTQSRANDSSHYDGNWGYAPGGYIWNPDDRWRRSRGFWDTNSPACPFRSC